MTEVSAKVKRTVG